MPLRKPSKTASFKEYIEYYMSRKNWSQSQLASRARLNQSQINKIINCSNRSTKMNCLVCICLALQLSVKESIDLLSRIERAFSPANPVHRIYLEVIDMYAKMELISDDEDMLMDADDYLEEKGVEPLPNVYV
ncbi:MAG: helix-turn-helix transcriptional regulator [Clostridia bacterium]|nr:helix-turn-helix transcriptional regulator [Clostridia bacterium]